MANAKTKECGFRFSRGARDVKVKLTKSRDLECLLPAACELLDTLFHLVPFPMQRICKHGTVVVSRLVLFL